jgi:hypothetical protein
MTTPRTKTALRVSTFISLLAATAACSSSVTVHPAADDTGGSGGGYDSVAVSSVGSGGSGGSISVDPNTPLLGTWRETHQIRCNGAALVEANPSIGELVMSQDGTFQVTWQPFENYVDYWGTFKLGGEATSAPSSSIVLTIDDGNFIPPDFQGTGHASVDSLGRLTLVEIWLGSPEPSASDPACGHRFE